MSRMIYADFERCCHCLGCEVACSREHGGVSHIQVILVRDRFAAPMMCRQCQPAPCAIVCPVQALTVTDSGVKLHPETCTGCSLCLFACPFGVMAMNPKTKTAAKCDQCETRTASGCDPVCVMTCPSSALRFEDYEEFTTHERQRFRIPHPA